MALFWTFLVSRNWSLSLNLGDWGDSEACKGHYYTAASDRPPINDQHAVMCLRIDRQVSGAQRKRAPLLFFISVSSHLSIFFS